MRAANRALAPGAAVSKFWTQREPRGAVTSFFLRFQTVRCREFMLNSSHRIGDLAKRCSSLMASRFIIALSFRGETWTLSWLRRKGSDRWCAANFCEAVAHPV